MVHAERAALVTDLEQLDHPSWDAASLCERWTVHDVVAHVVDTAVTTRVGFLVDLARARFDFDRQNERGVRRERGASPAGTVERLREVVERTSTPPAPRDSRIVEMVVHGEDIRRPLGLHRDYPPDAVVRAVHHQARTPLGFGGAKELVSAVRVTATDSDLDIGDGPRVSGPTLSLLLALSGRRVSLTDLEGVRRGAALRPALTGPSAAGRRSPMSATSRSARPGSGPGEGRSV